MYVFAEKKLKTSRPYKDQSLPKQTNLPVQVQTIVILGMNSDSSTVSVAGDRERVTGR